MSRGGAPSEAEIRDLQPVTRKPFRVSGFGFWVSGLGFRNSELGFWVSGFGLRVAGFEFRISGLGFWVSGLGLQVTGHGFQGTPWFRPRPVSGVSQYLAYSIEYHPFYRKLLP